MIAAAKTETPATRLDLASDAMAENPWPQLHQLREQGPVVWHETLNRWLITTDHDTRKMLIDFGRFTVEGTSVEDLFGSDAFISMDDRKRHDQLRNVWADAFRARGLAALQPQVQAIVARLMALVVERLRDGETADLSAGVCRPLPTMVIALLMGIPEEAIPDIVRWSDAMAAPVTYLAEAQAIAVRSTREAAKSGLAAYLQSLITARRKQAGDDLVSTLVHSEPGRQLSDPQMVQNLRQLLFAGNETTAKFLAQIFVVYGERPEIRRVLAADRSLITAANDEVMRWQPTVGTVVRRVRGGPIEVGGVVLAEGDDITCLIGSANRDPTRYADPDTYDLHRPPQPNLGFGVGFHNCLGSMLAKMEAELAIGALLDAVPEFTVAAPYRYSSLSLRGPLPVMVARDHG